MDEATGLRASFRVLVEEGTRQLKAQMAVINKQRALVGLPPLRVIEARAA